MLAEGNQGPNFDILNSFGRIYTYTNKTGLNYQLSVKIIQGSASTLVTDTVNYLLVNVWRRVSVSICSSKIKGLHDVIVYISSNTPGSMTGFQFQLIDQPGYL